MLNCKQIVNSMVSVETVEEIAKHKSVSYLGTRKAITYIYADKVKNRSLRAEGGRTAHADY